MGKKQAVKTKTFCIRTFAASIAITFSDCYPHTVESLLDHHARVYIKNKEDDTAFGLAQYTPLDRRGSLATIKILSQADATDSNKYPVLPKR